MSLRKAAIRLAYENPDLRSHLLPLIKEAAEQEARYEEGEDVPLSELPEELQENVTNPPKGVRKLREEMESRGKTASGVVSLTDGIQQALHTLTAAIWNRIRHDADYRTAFKLLSAPGNLGAYGAGFEAHILNTLDRGDNGYMLIRLDADPRERHPKVHMVLTFPRTSKVTQSWTFDWDDNESALLNRIWGSMQRIIDDFFMKAADSY